MRQDHSDIQDRLCGHFDLNLQAFHPSRLNLKDIGYIDMRTRKMTLHHSSAPFISWYIRPIDIFMRDKISNTISNIANTFDDHQQVVAVGILEQAHTVPNLGRNSIFWLLFEKVHTPPCLRGRDGLSTLV
jgi:hypothetical protein